MTRLAGLPSLEELGSDLRRLNRWERAFTLGVPFAWCGGYFAFALVDWWPAAVFCLVALSFVTYPSTSHDLVHRNLGLPKLVNDLLLYSVELLALRSGHAYQAAHLHHHTRFPQLDDVEARAAHRSWLGALAEGPTFQIRLWAWALRHGRRARTWVIPEIAACVVLLAAGVALVPFTPVFAVYAGLMVLGSWAIPFATSYVPHDPTEADPLFQTRAFRGWMATIIGIGHLYHLEHHLYPSVPHRNWRCLARRLDPYLTRAGVRTVRLWF